MSFRPRLTIFSDFKKTMPYGGALLGSLDPGRIAEEVFGPELHYGALFAYLYRRFGPPNANGDDHKEIASYTMTTPMEDLFLDISIKAQTDTRFLFRYVVSDTIDRKLLKIRQAPALKWRKSYFAWLEANGLKNGGGPDDRHELAIRFMAETKTPVPTAQAPFKKGDIGDRCNQALRETMLALKRPVFVRDVLIDPHGKETPSGRPIKRHKSAGYGIPAQFFDRPEEFGGLVEDLSKLGDGDVAKGLKKARKIIKQAA